MRDKETRESYPHVEGWSLKVSEWEKEKERLVKKKKKRVWWEKKRNGERTRWEKRMSRRSRWCCRRMRGMRSLRSPWLQGWVPKRYSGKILYIACPFLLDFFSVFIRVDGRIFHDPRIHCHRCTVVVYTLSYIFTRNSNPPFFLYSFLHHRLSGNLLIVKFIVKNWLELFWPPYMHFLSLLLNLYCIFCLCCFKKVSRSSWQTTTTTQQKFVIQNCWSISPYIRNFFTRINTLLSPSPCTSEQQLSRYFYVCIRA